MAWHAIEEGVLLKPTWELKHGFIDRLCEYVLVCIACVAFLILILVLVDIIVKVVTWVFSVFKKMSDRSEEWARDGVDSLPPRERFNARLAAIRSADMRRALQKEAEANKTLTKAERILAEAENMRPRVADIVSHSPSAK